MTEIRLTVNGQEVAEAAEPRTHLADFLREKLDLTGTHLRCEQGVCGACTILIDGQPARSCITFAALCEGAEVTTIEGLDDDPVMVSLREAFTREHGLQCGFCTPGMLVTARDIVLRLPDADEARVRAEISGNLCRCTGYVGIVRAICRVLAERREQGVVGTPPERQFLGPVGTRIDAIRLNTRAQPADAAASQEPQLSEPDAAPLGLGDRTPNIVMHKQAAIARPPAEVWAALADLAGVAECLPGARLTAQPAKDMFEGELAVKLGPISARFGGRGRVVRDDATLRGTILGSGYDRSSRSQTAGEVEYRLEPEDEGRTTRIDITLKALLSGPLARFGRSGIVDELASRMIATFARNLEQRLEGTAGPQRESRPLAASGLLWSAIVARLKAGAKRLFGRRG